MNLKIVDFFSGIQKSTWQEIVLTVILIPIIFSLHSRLKKWLTDRRPVNSLMKEYRKSNKEVLIFLSQLTAADRNGNRIENQPYISSYPQPIHGNPSNLGKTNYTNIHTVWTES